MPFGRDLAPAVLHRHPGHGEAVARISWCVDRRAMGWSPARSAPATPWPCARPPPCWIRLGACSSTWPTPPSGCAACSPISRSPSGTPRPFTGPPWHPRPRKRWPPNTPNGGRNPVLVIDEAHLPDNQQLEGIRLLTNHDMDSGSRFAVILIGQPSLHQRLRLGVLAALEQRIHSRVSWSERRRVGGDVVLRCWLAGLAGEGEVSAVCGGCADW
jgi:hypothetical protein